MESVLAGLSLKGPAEGDRHRVQSQLPAQTPGRRGWVTARCPTRCYAPREKGGPEADVPGWDGVAAVDGGGGQSDFGPPGWGRAGMKGRRLRSHQQPRAPGRQGVGVCPSTPFLRVHRGGASENWGARCPPQTRVPAPPQPQARVPGQVCPSPPRGPSPSSPGPLLPPHKCPRYTCWNS